MSIEAERSAVANVLAPLLGTSIDAVANALVAEYERSPLAKRTAVSNLASAAWLVALLQAMSESERHASLAQTDGRDQTRLERVLAGESPSVAARISDELAGPYDVGWDSNWPGAVALRRLRGQMPPDVRAGDIVVGGDGEGTRIDIRVVEEDDGCLTGLPLFPETWRDPPLEDVWSATYRRLEETYPHAVPPDVRRS